MIVIESQVHGYRHGHQMLAGSVQLPREDQAAVDRLSDIAGPLRPREKFEPYLTAYPLPSGDNYVLARTWQDLTVQRAGCVRTLSLIINTEDWGTAADLSEFIQLLALGRLPDEKDAQSVSPVQGPSDPLPPTGESMGAELLEALFLEEPRPVVVFDAPSPELVAIRLLTAMWPSMRSQFALSTFTLSPRKVSGRDFDLVFAPKDARSKFSDWGGRRIDARASQDARHRWTGAIVNRVFQAQAPQLLPTGNEGIVPEEGDASDSAAALRIALRWEELLAKLDVAPTAALGLLDIANSGKVNAKVALATLEPSLARAVRRAPFILGEDEAWDFLGAIARKTQGKSIPRVVDAINSAVEDLAARAPEGAVALLSPSDGRSVVANELLPAIAQGIGTGFTSRAQQALLSAPPEALGRMVAQSSKLAETVAREVQLIDHLGAVLPVLDASLVSAVGRRLLPYLVEDWQFPAARPLVEILDVEQLTAEVLHLGSVNDFAARQLADFCVRLAREHGKKTSVLAAIASLPQSAGRDAVLIRVLDSSVEDATWLIAESHLPRYLAVDIFVSLLTQADDQQLAKIIRDPTIGAEALSAAEHVPDGVLRRLILLEAVPLAAFVRFVDAVFPGASADERAKIGRKALQRCMRQRFDGDEVAFLSRMLGGVGKRLDGKWAAQLGLGHEVHASIASRNMIALCGAANPARLQFICSIADVAVILRGRHAFDLTSAAVDAFGDLLLEAERTNPRIAHSAAAELLPMLMRQRRDPVSLLVAATFPMVYRDLAQEDETPDLLKLMLFFDWDRRKVARQELVSAFLASSWSPSHLALTACRCSDVAKILRKAASSYGGDAYINRIASDLASLPVECRDSVVRTIDSIRGSASR